MLILSRMSETYGNISSTEGITLESEWISCVIQEKAHSTIFLSLVPLQSGSLIIKGCVLKLFYTNIIYENDPQK